MMILKEAWEQRKKLHVEGHKLHVEGDKFSAESDRLNDEVNNLCDIREGHFRRRAEEDSLWEEARKFRFEEDKIRAEGNRLFAEGNRIYAEAVIGFFGPNAIIDWVTGDVEGKSLPIPPSEVGL